MRTLFALACVTTLGACAAVDETSEDSSAVARRCNDTADVPFYTLFGNDNFIEADVVDGEVCGQLFFDVTSAEADTLAFWHVGVDAIYTDLPYPDDDRPNMYAVFAPSNPTMNHTVAGFEDFDHYHIAERASRNKHDALWDPFIVNPGPNFDAATYQVAMSVDEMWDQIAAGILAEPVTMIDAGFGPIVFHGEIACGHKLEKLYRKNGGE